MASFSKINSASTSTGSKRLLIDSDYQLIGVRQAGHKKHVDVTASTSTDVPAGYGFRKAFKI